MRFRFPKRILASSALAAAMLLGPAPAIAQSSKGNAEDLFQLGKAAMAKNDILKACGYFQGSLNADFALGTLLNLAICHEQAGKVASAWTEYRTLEDKARQANPPQTERQKFAHEHAEALRSRVSRVRIVLSPEAKALKGLVVKVDATVAQPELYDVGIPVDVGKHALTASAPDHDDWTGSVTVDDEKLKFDATVPGLALSPPKPVNTIVVNRGPSAEEVDRIAAAKSRRTVGFVIGGVGAVSLATGAVFGILAIGSKKDAACTSPCVLGTTKFNDAHDAYSRSNTFGWVSNITLIAGAIGVGAGAILVLTAGSAEKENEKKATAQLGISPNGVWLGGTL